MSITITQYAVKWDDGTDVSHVSMDRSVPEETLEAVAGHYTGVIVERQVTTSEWSPVKRGK